MPGLLFSINYDKNAVQKALNFYPLPGYSVNEILNNHQRFFVASNSQKNYPVTWWQRGDQSVYFEGMVYPSDDKTADELFKCFLPAGFQYQLLDQWVLNQDGEFVVLLIDFKTQQALLTNDRFGRLPLYLLKEGRKLAISRELSFLSKLTEFGVPDKTAQALNLLFGFIPGEKTLIDKIQRIPPHSRLEIDLMNGRFMMVNQFKIISPSDEVGSKDLDLLLHHLDSALENRVNSLPQAALSLSGGLDSRLLATLLRKNNRSLPWLTYADHESTALRDLHAVDLIVDRLGGRPLHQRIDLHQTSWMDVVELINLKQGMNPADMAFLLPFLRVFRHKDHVMLTGDGGDKTLDDLRPGVKIFSQKQLIRILIAKHSLIPLSMVGFLSETKQDEVLDYINETIKCYDAKSFEEKYIHFMIRERAMHWLFEGEDRNRYYCWTTTPYYNPDFFDLAMRIPMKAKAGGKVFKYFFPQLPGDLQEVVNPNWSAALTETHQLCWLFFKQRLKMGVGVYLGTTIKSSTEYIDLERFKSSNRFLPEGSHLITEEMNSRFGKMKLPEMVWFRIITTWSTKNIL